MGQTVRKSWTSAGLLAAGLWAALGTAGLILIACVPARAEQPVVDELVLHDTIQPVSTDEVTRALDRANSANPANSAVFSPLPRLRHNLPQNVLRRPVGRVQFQRVAGVSVGRAQVAGCQIQLRKHQKRIR